LKNNRTFSKKLFGIKINIAAMIASKTTVARDPLASRFTLLYIICLFFCLPGCTEKAAEKKIRIGFSQCTGDAKWIKATLEGINRELSFHPNAELLYENAKDNSDLQIRQIRDLVNRNIDVLVVSPNEAEPLTAIVEEVYNKGIPVVVVDRRINSNQYTAYVGPDNFEIGKMAGEYVANLYAPGSRLIEILGLKGSTPTTAREKGFEQGIGKHPQIRIAKKVYGNWLKEKAQEELLKIKDDLSANDIVFAHNDPMALGAYEIYKKLGLEKTVRFIGVDGLAGQGGGIEFVSDKVLRATLLNPTGGEESVELAFKILDKEPFEKENTLTTVVIDSSNVRIMKLQTDKINTQQNDIENQKDLLAQQRQLYESQNTVINIIITALLLVLILGAVAVYALLNNRKKNKLLARQNQEIIEQQNQLVEITAKAQEATEAKFNFFTNISHEFRTPLTLIIGPLEDCLASSRLHFSLRNNLQLIHRNTMRLLRLINQLMDFRKIEERRMKLRVTEQDLVPFVSEITDAFQVLARKKSIALETNCKVRSLPLWFDNNMLDKVLFNLLSNAFKFSTDHGGLIRVTIDKTPDDTMAVIRIEDSGVGMTKAEIEQAFDVFYQGSAGASKGTGLGLALSKEMVELHHGQITLKSERWKGTSFEVQLPLGNAHFQENEILKETAAGRMVYEDVKIYMEECENGFTSPAISLDGLDNAIASSEKKYSILVIEDNPDLRQFLKNKLGEEYEIHEAENGKAGLHGAFEYVPDLIICDIIMPLHDGLYVTETLKQDIRTSHIPLILLTAKGSMEEQIKGIRLQADAFIVKPFNLEYLMETVKSLLKNRAILKDHYSSELPTDVRMNTAKKIDRKFISEFSAIVEGNISNENFSVEDICREIGISRVQLYRKVKALLDYNVNDYILTTRMQKAKFLLMTENLSISEVASKVGFSSQAYFATVFKSKFFVTPREFRESKKKLAE